ncbi:DUF6090 family protein [Winogradskyella sp. UBA3174]|uniref:DUF6090 family protein n=1 Tax=Winogradskyella sp. UBA3174 TaxID=1947785 RepID=UPI0025E0768D|nr:DUF6090 family protein [Winogradskyella sp. UBA3174]|tara:strand:- start:9672 stop:10328 length:657 start_codon:yes stop_codon:yes gene_type:complete
MANKTSKWQYTLREIVIVIIGISIAFSMNKCADNVKDNKLKKEYLTNLKSDIEADKVQLAENITAINQKIEMCSQLIPMLNTGKKQGMPLMDNVFAVLKYQTFNPKNITYKTLINSGDLKLINDFQLKTAIQGHYSNYEDIYNVANRHMSLIQDHLGRYMINNADYDQLMVGNTPFSDEIKLKNIVRALSSTFSEKKKVKEDGMASCDALILEIDKAL